MGVLEGSIPALTGKPYGAKARKALNRVYPRAYGETRSPFCAATCSSGLSPRLRGNQHHAYEARALPGSIPALTGKPPCWSATFTGSKVYPRAYGETNGSMNSYGRVCGLSPRLRGNQVALLRGHLLIGSIPALTGKPATSTPMVDPEKVYPRAYGETERVYASFGLVKGLSPRLRGNQQTPIIELQRQRSIPALTGKPRRDTAVSWARRVYPRAYGETLRRQR